MSAYVSLTELFSLGIGPSSSHTVGPMRAAADFVDELHAAGRLDRVEKVECILYGALAATGIGHGTPDAVVAGLAGARPETCDPDDVRGAWRRLGDGAPVALGGTRPVIVRERDVVFAPLTRMPVHTNALRLRAVDGAGSAVADRVYYSVGGGFVVPENARPPAVDDGPAVPFPFTTAGELLEICAETGNSIAEVADANEAVLIGADRVPEAVDRIWSAMVSCIESGVATEGRLPGGLDVVRRAPGLYRRLVSTGASHDAIDWLQTYAMAVNEENAAGGRVVTAPTNGAAGIVPAVGRYYEQFLAGGTADMRTFLLTATAIGSLVKANASISGAEAGCQGEVGSACAMAGGALCAVLGGTPAQVEYAAEIAMEHHLGLTCDPVGGLVQIPCIERNGIAAVTALSAARMALNRDGSHVVSLDTVIETMRQTGLDMSDKYKETSTGGLALNVVMC
ncbi:L-serine ammonia-lyase [Rhodococcus koreensis]|uniref:L-serine dehydratase n=1 Tax=Rhodococcus koreensis TaxID=99653 RepID=A0A1H4UTJ0_9NOCA|nr:L-serine ammonia-lyase [Rhodococcus koreensis]QSE81557.1 L-serine ammonia-lyase [Rhodococcus koreensis]SEC71860.1 L-serine dehydratase [Rhodococcus koreensis]